MERSQQPPDPPVPRRPKRRSWALWVLLAFVAGGFTTCAVSIVQGLPPGVPSRTVLEIDFEQPIAEVASSDPLGAAIAGGSGTELRDVVDALDRAAADERVVGLYARIGGGGWGMAQTQELRDAVLRFRASGKPTLAFAETFGEALVGQGGYLLATAFDTIWLQPSGDVGLVGFASETPFFRGSLEKLGVEPRFAGRKEYKTFVNQYTEQGLTEPHRETLERVLDLYNAELVQGLVTGRRLDEGRAQALLLEGPFSAKDAVARGLVDALGYRDEALAALEQRVGPGAERLYAERYLARAGRPHAAGSKVALVYAVGAVMRGSGGSFSPLAGGTTLGSDTVGAALRAAVRDEDVRAIILRVDSPGGSWVASDAIRREVERARAAGKPVVVSMGNLGASGGYALSMSADRIVAQPGTLTGSIGVGGGKMALEGLWRKLGVGWGRVETAPNSGMLSLSRDFTDAQWARFERWLDQIYSDFVAAAAKGRGLPVEELEAVAKGRVWTGLDAKERGLVDALGGLDVAYAEVRELLSLPEKAPLSVQRFPRRLEPFEALLASFDDERTENSDSLSGTSLPGTSRMRLVPREVSAVLERLWLEATAGRDAVVLFPPDLWPLTSL